MGTSHGEPTLADLLDAIVETRDEVRRVAAFSYALAQRIAVVDPPAVGAEDIRITAVIESLAPAPYRLRRPITASIERHGGEYLARFAEAGIQITGATAEDAVVNLKSLILEIYEDLKGETADPRQRARLAALRDVIAERTELPADR